MNRTVFAVFAFLVVLAHAGESKVGHTVNLNAPGAMEKLATDNPVHHAKVERILAEIGRQSVDTASEWMKTEFDAEGVIYGHMIKTSDPAKTYLSFTLDRTRYERVITLSRDGRLGPLGDGHLVPLR